MAQKNSKPSSSLSTGVTPKIIKTQKNNGNSLRQGLFRSVENFILIWLDSNINEANEDVQNFIDHLRRIANSIQTFIDVDRCVDYLTEVKNEKVFLIVSGSFAQNIVPLISEMTQLASIFIFCGDKSEHQRWSSNYKKVKGVFTQIEALCDQLKLDVRLSENALTSMSIVSSPSTTDLNQLDSSFMYSQLLKEILLEHQPDPKEKKQFVDFCRLHYADNDAELKVIEEFEREFPRPSPIWWYTRECFLYPMLNKALRTQDIEVIFKIGFVVRDLHQNIERIHKQQKDQRPLVLYRGQGMKDDEFDKIHNSKGALLAFNNFLSTSTDRRISEDFARRARDNHDLTAVLFRINVDPKLSTTPFAEG